MMAEFQALPEYAGKFNPGMYTYRDKVAACKELASHPSYATDPFAYARAMNAIEQGIHRPSDIRSIVSV